MSKTVCTPDGWSFGSEDLEQAVAKMMREELDRGNPDRIDAACKAAKEAMAKLQEDGADAMDALVTMHTYAPTPIED